MHSGMSETSVRRSLPHELPEILDVIESANPHLHARLSRFRASHSAWIDATPMVCEAHGRVRSVALLVRRCLWAPGGPIPVAGIGAVSTRPDSEGRGFASRLIRGCEQELARQGFASAVLFCTIVGFYERLGWTEVAAPQPALPVPQADAALRFETVPLSPVPPEIRALYEASATGAIVRSEELWRDYDVWRREDEDLFQAAHKGDRLLGYVRARRNGRHVELLEATGQAIPALLAELLRLTGSEAIRTGEAAMMVRPLQPRPKIHQSPRTWWGIDRF